MRVAEMAVSMYAGKLPDEAYTAMHKLGENGFYRGWRCEWRGIQVPPALLRAALHYEWVEDWAAKRHREGSQLITDALVWLK